MDYLTNYYKNRCQQLQEHINKLQYVLENIAPEPMLFAEPEMLTPGEMAPPSYSGHPSNSHGMGGDGLAPGWEDPFKKGWKSREWQEWIKKPGNYHRNNPHPYGSPEFYRWEWEYYDVPPT